MFEQCILKSIRCIPFSGQPSDLERIILMFLIDDFMILYFCFEAKSIVGKWCLLCLNFG
jgi:hypothetical protein